MKALTKLIWCVLYFPAGMAWFFTMCFGIGIILLVVDVITLIIGNGSATEFPPGFFVVMYACLCLRLLIARLFDWDITEFLPR